MSFKQSTRIYLAPYHSSFKGYGKGVCTAAYLPLSRALERSEWPYDVGDDPSFYSRKYFSGQLTWGICRQQIRNRVEPGDMIVFFSFRRRKDGEPTEYRLCAIATVARKVSQADLWRDPEFAVYRRYYLNLLIRPGKEGVWEHYEKGAPRPMWHTDWAWRIADHRGLTKSDFKAIHDCGNVRRSTKVIHLPFKMARNYVIFSKTRSETQILSDPPIVAWCEKSAQAEEWNGDAFSRAIRKRTVDMSSRHGGRGTLRTRNLWRPHPCDSWAMSATEVVAWREGLIDMLRRYDRRARS